MTAHYITLPTGRELLIHPCETCGVANAPFGYNVNLRKGKLGLWYCYDHRPDTEPLTASMRDNDDRHRL